MIIVMRDTIYPTATLPTDTFCHQAGKYRKKTGSALACALRYMDNKKPNSWQHIESKED